MLRVGSTGFRPNRRMPAVVAVFAAAAFTAAGCAGNLPAPPSDEVRSRLGAVEVVAGTRTPEVWVTHPAEAVVRGGAEGCVAGCLAGVYVLTHGQVEPPLSAPVGGALLGAGLGAGMGALAGLGAKQRAQAEILLRGGLEASGGSEELAGEVQRAVRQRVGARATPEGPCPTLTVSIEEIGLQAYPFLGADLRAYEGWHSLVLSAVFRLDASPGGGVAYERSVTARGAPVVAKDWLQNRPERVKDQIGSLMRAAAGLIADEVAWLYLLPGQGDLALEDAVASSTEFGLRVVTPPWTQWTVSGPAVDTLRPTLAWEAFPREQDRVLTPEIANRVTDVVYDLRLASMRMWSRGTSFLVPSDDVYARDGLPEPRHTVEETLWANRPYFWTVRARFTLDGQPRATEWAAPDERGRRTAPPLNSASHQFMTPK